MRVAWLCEAATGERTNIVWEVRDVNEKEIARAIIESYTAEWLQNLSAEVCVVGAGPSGLLIAKRLAEGGLRTVLFEKRMSLGGGLWGGGMLLSAEKVAGLILQDLGSSALLSSSVECSHPTPKRLTHNRRRPAQGKEGK